MGGRQGVCGNCFVSDRNLHQLNCFYKTAFLVAPSFLRWEFHDKRKLMSFSLLLSWCAESDISLTKVIKIWRAITVCIFILLQSHGVLWVYPWKNEWRFCFCGSATRRNSILFIFVLILQFIAIRAKKTYIICRKDRPGNFGEPPISDNLWVCWCLDTKL